MEQTTKNIKLELKVVRRLAKYYLGVMSCRIDTFVKLQDVNVFIAINHKAVDAPINKCINSEAEILASKLKEALECDIIVTMEDENESRS